MGQGSRCLSRQQGWRTPMSKNTDLLPRTDRCSVTHGNLSLQTHSTPPGYCFPFLRCQLPNRKGIMDSFLQNAAHTSPCEDLLLPWGRVVLRQPVSFNSAHHHGDPPIEECAGIYVPCSSHTLFNRLSSLSLFLNSLSFCTHSCLSLPSFYTPSFNLQSMLSGRKHAVSL